MIANWGGENDYDTADGPQVERAAAVLLVEIAQSDGSFDRAEHQAIERILIDQFDIDHSEAQQIITEARTTSNEAVSIHPHTRCLNDHLDTEQKRQLLTQLWRLAHSDGHIDPQEEYTIRKLCGLLNLRHRDFIQAKLSDHR